MKFENKIITFTKIKLNELALLLYDIIIHIMFAPERHFQNLRNLLSYSIDFNYNRKEKRFTLLVDFLLND